MANETCWGHEAHHRPACPGGPQPYKTHSFVPPVRYIPSPSSAPAPVELIEGLYVHVRKNKSPTKQVLGLLGSQAVLSWPARLTQVSPSPGPVISGSDTSDSSTHHAPHPLMASDRAQFNSRAVGSEGRCPTRQTIPAKEKYSFRFIIGAGTMSSLVHSYIFSKGSSG